MADNIKAKIPTFEFDERGNRITKELEIRRPTRAINNGALERAKRHESRGTDLSIARQEAMLNLVRMCVVRYGERPLSELDMEGDKLYDVFTEKQVNLLLQLLGKITGTTPEMADFCYLSMSPVVRSGETRAKLRAAKLPSGKIVNEQFEYRTVEFKLPSRSTLSAAREAASVFASRSKLLTDSETDLNLVRMSLTRIDGNEVQFEDLRGDGLEKHLTAPEMSCLMHVLTRCIQPTRDETADFLATIEM